MANLPDSLSPRPVGRQRIPREVMDEHQRERIIDAAIGVFAKRGYKGTTIDHIVAASHVGVGSFYALFEGKEDCFLRSYDRIVSTASEQIAAAAPAAAPWPERVCAGLRSLLELIAAEPLSARIALVEVQTAGPPALTRYQVTLDDAIATIRDGRELFPRADELPPTLEEAAVSGVAWLLHQQLVMGEVKGIGQLFPDLVAILLEPYVGKAGTERLIAASLAARSTTA